MKFFKYFPLFLFTILLNFNVYAKEYNVTSQVTSPTGGSSTGGRYEGTELNGSTGTFKTGTRYLGTLTRIRYNIPVPSGVGSCYWTNMTYRVTMYMATEDWRNRFGSVKVNAYGTNYSSGKVTYVSYKKIYFTFKIPSSESTCIDYVLVDLPSNGLFNPFTGDKNWNLSKITLTDQVSSSSSGGSSGGSSTPTPTPNPDYSSIINNQNENTQNLIDNQNENTQDIIDNANENTDKIIQNEKDIFTNSCSNKFDTSNYATISENVDFQQLEDGFRLNTTNQAWGLVVYMLPVQEGKTYYFNGKYLSQSMSSVIVSLSYSGPGGSDIVNNRFYNYEPSSIADEWSTTFTSDRDGYVYAGFWVTKTNSSNNVVYLRVMYSDVTATYCPYGSTNSNKIDETNQKLDEINNSINNSGIDDKTGFFSNFQNDDHGLTSIITLPLTTIQSLTNTSCVALSVPIPFTNRNVSLPCMTQVYQQHIPTIFNLWQIVSFGIISYFICIDIFKMVKGFKDPNEDKVEVLDL